VFWLQKEKKTLNRIRRYLLLISEVKSFFFIPNELFKSLLKFCSFFVQALWTKNLIDIDEMRARARQKLYNNNEKKSGKIQVNWNDYTKPFFSKNRSGSKITDGSVILLKIGRGELKAQQKLRNILFRSNNKQLKLIHSHSTINISWVFF
jgi:hypothetical protein